MTARVDPPFDGTLRFYRAWCREHDGVLEVVHKNPRGVISITQGGYKHVYHHDKYGKGDGKYSWSSTMMVGFLTACVNAYIEANPDAYKALLPTDSAEHYRDEHDRIFGKRKE